MTNRLLTDALATHGLLTTPSTADAAALAAAGIAAEGDTIARGLAVGAKASTSSLDRRAKFLRVAAKAAVRNPTDLAADATLATITTSAGATSGLTTTFGNDTHPELFTFYGGLPGLQNTYYFKCKAASVVSGGTAGSTGMQYGARMAFMTDAPSIDIVSAGSATKFRILVNGQYVSKSGTSYFSTTGSPTINLAFASRLPRRIDFEWEQNGGPQSASPTLRVTALDSVWAVDTADRIRIAVYGDSYSTGSGATLQSDSWASHLGRLLGGIDADVWQVAIGGTGYVTVGGQYSFTQHLTDLSAAAFDMVVFAGGLNDAGSAGIQAAALTCFQSARNQLPHAPIIVLGPWCGEASNTTNVLAAETAIAAAVTQFADSNTFFVPTRATFPIWQTGTGKVGATNGSGNSDVYIVNAGTHPSDAGHEYLGRRAASSIRALIPNFQ